jgi:antiviral helicase SLH1
MTYSDLSDDPSLSVKRRQLVTAAAQALVKARMITFNELTEAFIITERGQIAARYYIRHQSIEIFNKEMRPVMTEADVLRLISKSTEVGNTNLLLFLADG